jgi:hypothetical protein
VPEEWKPANVSDRILPGWSARRRALAVVVILGAFVVSAILGLVFNQLGFIFLGLLGLAVVRFMGMIPSPREAEEVRAGYSTVPGHTNVDFVDAETSQVIRPAEPARISSLRFETNVGAIVGVTFGGLMILGISAFAGVRHAQEFGDAARGVGLSVGIVAAFVLLFGIIAVGISASARRDIRRVRALRPDAEVFETQSTILTADALAVLGTITPKWNFPVSFTTDAVEFWLKADGLSPDVAIPWSDIDAIGTGTAQMKYGDQTSSAPAVFMSMRHAGRAALTLALPVYDPGKALWWSVKAGNRVLDAAQARLAASRTQP